MTGARRSRSALVERLGAALLLAFLAAARAGCSTGALEDPEYLIFAHNQQFFSVDLDFRTAVLAEEDSVTRLDIQCLARAVFLIFAFANGNHFTFLRFLFRRVGNDDAAANLLAFFNARHDYAVVQWFDIRSHDLSSVLLSVLLPGIQGRNRGNAGPV